MEISAIIPAFNEEENIYPLYQKLSPILANISPKHEIIFIDDGSSDKTYAQLTSLRNKDSKVKIIKFKKNFGQTAAWDAGFKLAQGKLVVVMDADLQNNPEDIPAMIEKLNQGYDVISGWRYQRKDPFSKRIFSKFSNRLRKFLTGETINDSGCSLKVYKKECIKSLNLQGEMHRYITAILSWKGYKIGEMKVRHHARKFGQTKYSASRLFKGMMDLLMITFWQRYSSRPIHLFGFAGLITAFIGFVLGMVSIYLRLFRSVDLSDTFLPNISVFAVLMGINLIIFGIIADICVKIYYKDEKNYLIEKIEKIEKNPKQEKQENEK